MIVKPKRLVLLLAGVFLLLVGAVIFFKAPSAESISSALDDTIIEELTFREATPDEVLSTVMNHFHEKHPELRKFHLEYYPTFEAVRSPPPAALEWYARITISLTKIPATEALKYVKGLSGLNYMVRPGIIYIYIPENQPPPTFRERLDSVLDWFRSLFSNREHGL